MVRLDRSLMTEEQLYERDHLAEAGRVVAFVTAVWVTAAAAGALVGWGLAHAFSAANTAINRHHSDRRPHR